MLVEECANKGSLIRHYLMEFNHDFAKGGGLIPAIAQDVASGEVLMLAYMNEDALNATLETGEVHYYSRSRNCLWGMAV